MISTMGHLIYSQMVKVAGHRVHPWVHVTLLGHKALDNAGASTPKLAE